MSYITRETKTITVSQVYGKPIEGVDEDGNTYRIWSGCEPVFNGLVLSGVESWTLKGDGMTVSFNVLEGGEQSKLLHEAANDNLSMMVKETVPKGGW